MLLDAIKAWPEFDLFTAGYALSGQPAHSDLFAKDSTGTGRTRRLCRRAPSTGNPVLAEYPHLETRSGPKRACWSSWIARHNFKGFFLNMGDMLVKAAD